MIFLLLKMFAFAVTFCVLWIVVAVYYTDLEYRAEQQHHARWFPRTDPTAAQQQRDQQ